MCKCYKVSVSVYKYTCAMFNCNVSCDYVYVYGAYNAVCVLHVQSAHSVCCAPYVYM